jgi:biotin carboxylase
MKKLLILGGDHFAIPVVEAAKKQGYYVITCDYLPDNVAHKYSDEFANFSTTDKEGILAFARDKEIDGICTFTDSGVVTTAYVQHHLGLPSIGPLESVEILQNKDRFRSFLSKHNFNVPQAKGFDSVDSAMSESYWFPWPVIVKPTDSAGSKGVTRVDRIDGLKSALEYAMKFSVSSHIIVEEFIEKDGCSSDSDCFSIDGQLVVATFSAQRFDEDAKNPYAPSAYTWPSTFGEKYELELKSDIQRLLTLLGMKTSVYNVETRIGKDGKAYIMEVSPRGGGNRLSEMVRMSTGADMITSAVRAAVGDDISLKQNDLDGHWAEIILHSDKTGDFSDLQIVRDYEKYVCERDLWVKEGDRVEEFTGANKAIGTLVLKFQTAEELEYAITHQADWLKVVVK